MKYLANDFIQNIFRNINWFWLKLQLILVKSGNQHESKNMNTYCHRFLHVIPNFSYLSKQKTKTFRLINFCFKKPEKKLIASVISCNEKKKHPAIKMVNFFFKQNHFKNCFLQILNLIFQYFTFKPKSFSKLIIFLTLAHNQLVLLFFQNFKNKKQKTNLIHKHFHNSQMDRWDLK